MSTITGSTTSRQGDGSPDPGAPDPGTPDQAAHGHDEHHDPTLAHHFESHAQQFDSAKVGMWVFLATEILMFGGLFVAYAYWRANHTIVFDYAHTHLKWELGAINTVILITSSFTMAWAVRAAQLQKKTMLVTLLALTILGGCGFLVVKAFEYHDKYTHGIWVGAWNKYRPDNLTAEGRLAAASYGEAHATDASHAGDAGPEGGATGATAATPAAGAEGQGHGDGDGGHATRQPTVVVAGDQRSNIEPAPAGPVGMSASLALPAPEAAVPEDADGDAPAVDDAAGPGDDADDAYAGGHGGKLSFEELPPVARAHTHQFFQIYFMMTGLHTLHVIIGIGLIAWILIRAQAGHFTSTYFIPVDLVGLYWHLVDLIWIFLFPLLYLIH